MSGPISSGPVAFSRHRTTVRHWAKKSGTVRQCHGIITEYAERSKDYFCMDQRLVDFDGVLDLS